MHEVAHARTDVRRGADLRPAPRAPGQNLRPVFRDTRRGPSRDRASSGQAESLRLARA